MGETVKLSALRSCQVGSSVLTEVQRDVDDVERFNRLCAVGGKWTESVGVGGVQQDAIAERGFVLRPGEPREERRAIPAEFGPKCRGIAEIVLNDQGGEVVERGRLGAVGSVG